MTAYLQLCVGVFLLESELVLRVLRVKCDRMMPTGKDDPVILRTEESTNFARRSDGHHRVARLPNVALALLNGPLRGVLRRA